MFKKPNRSYLFKKKIKSFKVKIKLFKIQRHFCSTLVLDNHLIIYNNLFNINILYNWNNYFYIKLPLLKVHFFWKKMFLKKYLFLLSYFRYFFLKLRFYGKTFKWVFSKKKIKFRVQKPHRSIILFKNLKFKKKKKLKFKLRIFNLRDKKAFVNAIKKIKYINIFTKKGMRILKMKYNKKKGKVSGYM